MNPVIYYNLLLLICLFCSACGKESIKKCNEIPMTGLNYQESGKTIIPLNQRNFWIYDDSFYNNQEKKMNLRSKNFIMYIQSFSKLNEQYILDFNQFMPPITVIGDTIFTVDYTSSSPNNSNCYKYLPYLFRATDTVYLNSEKTNKIYPSKGQIKTKLGMLSYNYVYNNENSYYQYINDTIGIIRYENRNSDTTFIRSRTINNYELFK